MQDLDEFERVVCNNWGLVNKNPKWSLYLLPTVDWSRGISDVPQIGINFIGVSLSKKTHVSSFISFPRKIIVVFYLPVHFALQELPRISSCKVHHSVVMAHSRIFAVCRTLSR